MSYQDTLPSGLPNDEFTPDLEPTEASNALIGEPGLSAADVKELYGKLPDLSKADLRQIPIVPEGTRLETGAQYLDLADRAHGPFTAMGEETVAFDQYIVPKAQVDYLLWNRLIGVTDPARLDQPDRAP
jgi:hypothetical protein